MSFRIKLAFSCIAAGMTVTQLTLAEMEPLQQSNSVTLSSLTQKVYELDPARHNELAQQQQIKANTDLANEMFANAKSINVNHQNAVIGSRDGFQEWEGVVQMPLWLPGQKQQQLSLSNKLSAELPAYQQQVRLAASATVRELVWNVVLTNTASYQAYQSWQLALKLQHDVAVRVKAGELAGTEGLLADTNALDMQNHYLLKKSEFDFAFSTYRAITQEQLLPQTVEEPLSDNYVIDLQHPSLMMLDQHINTLRAKQDLAQFSGAVNPNLSLGVRSERGSTGDSFTNSLGVGISFALDNDVYQGPAVANAAKALADVQIMRQQLERELNITLFSHLHDLETKRLQLDLLSEQNETTQQYLALQQRAFELGELDLVSLLRSQSLANETYNRKIALEVDIKHTIALINQALGIVL